MATAIDRLEDLCALVEAQRDEAEAMARMTPAVRDAAGAAGLWVLNAPKEVGGLELPLPDLLTVYERVAVADPTVAWHCANSAAAGSLAGQLDDDGLAALFETTARPFAYSGALTAAVSVVEVEGGFRVNGRWPFMTGAADASWAIAVAMVSASDGAPRTPDVRRMLIPMSELEVHETWQAASAMRGTGSHAVSAHDIVVPASRALPLAAPLRIDRPLFRAPLTALFLTPCASIAAGILRSAIAGVVNHVSAKVSRFDGHAHYDDPRVQQTVADATAAAECLSAGLAVVTGHYWDALVDGREPDQLLRANLWSVVFAAFDTVRRHVSDLYAIGTSSSYATRNPVERALRDIHALSAAFDSFQSVRRAAGRVLIGHDANNPRF